MALNQTNTHQSDKSLSDAQSPNKAKPTPVTAQTAIQKVKELRAKQKANTPLALSSADDIVWHASENEINYKIKTLEWLIQAFYEKTPVALKRVVYGKVSLRPLLVESLEFYANKISVNGILCAIPRLLDSHEIAGERLLVIADNDNRRNLKRYRVESMSEFGEHYFIIKPTQKDLHIATHTTLRKSLLEKIASSQLKDLSSEQLLQLADLLGVDTFITNQTVANASKKIDDWKAYTTLLHQPRTNPKADNFHIYQDPNAKVVRRTFDSFQ